MVGELNIVLEAQSPWWLSDLERRSLTGCLKIHLRGVQASELHVEWREFDSEQLSVLSEDPKLWAFGERASLFGNAPVPDPLEYLTELADWLRDKDLPTDVRDYCGGHGFADLAQHLSHQTYAVMSGPRPIVDEAARLLAVRGVPTTVLAGRPVEKAELLLLEMGSSWIICENGHVDLSEAAG